VNTWKIILATIVIFGTGIVTGSLVGRHTETIQLPRRPAHANAPRPGPISFAGGLRLEFLKRAERELDLTPAQHERIDRIMKESQERTREIMEPVAPELRAELQKTKEQFVEVLTIDQRKRFEELIKKQHPRPRDQRRSGAPHSEPTVQIGKPPQ
jgi:Spy/CpxP family protein refolding chaperone